MSEHVVHQKQKFFFLYLILFLSLTLPSLIFTGSLCFPSLSAAAWRKHVHTHMQVGRWALLGSDTCWDHIAAWGSCGLSLPLSLLWLPRKGVFMGSFFCLSLPLPLTKLLTGDDRAQWDDRAGFLQPLEPTPRFGKQQEKSVPFPFSGRGSWSRFNACRRCVRLLGFEASLSTPEFYSRPRAGTWTLATPGKVGGVL